MQRGRFLIFKDTSISMFCYLHVLTEPFYLIIDQHPVSYPGLVARVVGVVAPLLVNIWKIYAQCHLC